MNETINPFWRELTAEETRTFFMGSAVVRKTDDKEVALADEPQPPTVLPYLDPRYLAGCELVRRMGTLKEVAEMKERCGLVREINRQTRAWLRQQSAEAA